MAMTEFERKEFIELKAKVNGIEGKINTILSIVKGIAIGLAIGALVFGWISLKDFLHLAK